jgi:hypothetical protein
MKSNHTVNGNEKRRICRHFLEGRIDMPKLCLFDHACHHCAYDQWLEETGRAENRPPVNAVPTCGNLAA